MAIAPGQIAADPTAADQMARIVRAVEHKPFHHPEVRFDGVEPTGVCRGGDDGHPMRAIEPSQDRMAMRIQVVHDDVQPLPDRVARPESVKRGPWVWKLLLGGDVAQGISAMKKSAPVQSVTRFDPRPG